MGTPRIIRVSHEMRELIDLKKSELRQKGVLYPKNTDATRMVALEYYELKQGVKRGKKKYFPI